MKTERVLVESFGLPKQVTVYRNPTFREAMTLLRSDKHAADGLRLHIEARSHDVFMWSASRLIHRNVTAELGVEDRGASYKLREQDDGTGQQRLMLAPTRDTSGEGGFQPDAKHTLLLSTSFGQGLLESGAVLIDEFAWMFQTEAERAELQEVLEPDEIARDIERYHAVPLSECQEPEEDYCPALGS